MLNRFKYRKGDKYEDIDGDDKIDMDLTDPAMKQAAGINENAEDGVTNLKELRHNLSPVEEDLPSKELAEGGLYTRSRYIKF